MSSAMPEDVTAQLVESEARYRAFIENASDMIQSVRPDGTFEFVNRAWFRKLQYAPEDLPRLAIWDIIHRDVLDHCQQAFQLVMAGQTLDHVEAIFVARDGTAIPVEGDATPRFVDGVIVATHSFFRDVTERVRARELEARNAQLEREHQARYLEKMAALGKLSAGLSHELNNPASAAQRASRHLGESMARQEAALRPLVVAGLTVEQWDALENLTRREPIGVADPLAVSRHEEALADWLVARGIGRAWELAPRLVQAGLDGPALDRATGSLPPPLLAPALSWLGESLTVRDATDVVTRSMRRITALVSAVKSYSHMDRATELEVDVHDGLDDTLIMLGHRLKEMTVERDYDRALPPVRALGSSLNQVWTNILDNAIDATGGRGTIVVRTRRDGDALVVELGDDGAGIAPGHLSRIFEPFFTTKSQGQGTGLGLDTAWRIVTDEHRGRIEAESIPGRTVFRVYLPLPSA